MEMKDNINSGKGSVPNEFDLMQGAPLQQLPSSCNRGTPMTGVPMTGAPMTGMPMTGAPMTGMPMTGAPMTGMPATGMPATGGVQFTDFEALPMLNGTIPITAESMQYLNGFLRTQIGRRVRVDFLIGTNSFVDKEGILLGVGVNYILINETETDDITACDFYNIRFIKFYY